MDSTVGFQVIHLGGDKTAYFSGFDFLPPDKDHSSVPHQAIPQTQFPPGCQDTSNWVLDNKNKENRNIQSKVILKVHF